MRAGTSGFSFKEWKGVFYPQGVKEKDFLRYFASQLATVEINATFYRMPKAEVLRAWAEQVPAGFTFVLKASQRMTHRKKLVEVGEDLRYFWSNATALGPHLGPVLFQLPPFLRRDDERLARFLDELPETMRAVMEFRHRSWFDEPVITMLRERRVALCLCDTDPGDKEDPGLEQPFVATTPWGYLRLRRAEYDEAALRSWLAQARALGFEELFAFFKHEPSAPRLALELQRLAGSA